MIKKRRLTLRIITPNQIINDSNHESIQLPGFFGSFTILPDHENYFGLLKAGIVSVTNNYRSSYHCIISQSFFQFHNAKNICEIMSEYATLDLQIEDLEQDITKKIKNSNNQNEKDFYKVKLLYKNKTI